MRLHSSRRATRSAVEASTPFISAKTRATGPSPSLLGKCFLYSSRTNLFISLSPSLFKQLSVIKKSHQQEVAIDALEDDIKRKLIKAKVFSSKFEDESFITQKKLIKYNQSFQEKELGIVLLPTFACNFQCPYCYESNLPSVFMDEETEDQIIQFIKKNKGADRLHLCWHGGEPLLAFKNIERILKKIESEDTIKIKNHSMVSKRKTCVFVHGFHWRS